MSKKIQNKALAIMLIITLTFANLMLLASVFIPEAIAKAADLEFDAYFKVNGNPAKNKIANTEEVETLYLDIKINEGYLKDAKIEIMNSSSFSIVKNIDTSDNSYISKVEGNVITLNQMSQMQETLQIPVEMVKNKEYDLSLLDKQDNIVKLYRNLCRWKWQNKSLRKRSSIKRYMECCSRNSSNPGSYKIYAI